MSPLEPLHARLPGIDLPRMEIEDVRQSGALYCANALVPQSVGNQKEIAAAAPRDPAPAKADARDADFVEPVAEQDDRLAGFHPVEPTIAIVRDSRDHGRIVFEADFLQDRHGP